MCHRRGRRRSRLMTLICLIEDEIFASEAKDEQTLALSLLCVPISVGLACSPAPLPRDVALQSGVARCDVQVAACKNWRASAPI